ncbi:MAG: rhomboid family intramembrane serine protease [Methylotenera sp.]|nr:rhomboid family intramembrane serine protease [Oligoflexia bacterium]
MPSIRLTPTIKALVIAIFATFVIQQTADQFFGANLLGWLALIPSAVVIDHRIWQLFTYAFLHGDVMHLFLNLMMLVFIGTELETAWGRARFLRYYFFCSLSAGALYLILQLFVWKGNGLNTPMVGASGAIYGLLMAYGLIFGERVMLFMMLFPMKAKHFVWILAGIEFMTTVFSARGGLASAAHLGGMIAGFGYLWVRASISVAKKRSKTGKVDLFGFKSKKKSKAKSHLKLVIDNEREDARVDDGAGHDPKTWH